MDSEIHTTDYQSGYQYKEGILQFFPHAEGYVNVLEENFFNYVYNYTDHLGNIRLSYGIDPESFDLVILEENHYYPFGMKHANYNVGLRTYIRNNMGQIELPLVSDVNYKYKYNGKELQDELGLNFYDYGARNYDAALGRWMNIDPLAEISRRWSPYTYCYNNPIFFVDPDGMQVDPASQAEWNTQKQAVTVQRDIQKSIGDAFSMGLGNFTERVISLNSTLSTLNKLEESTQVYSLNNNAGEFGGIKYDSKTGNIVLTYSGTANFVHESTHAGQFESHDLAFESENGKTYAQDVFDEVAAYKAQYAYDSTSVSGVPSSSQINSSSDITPAWVQNITASNGSKPYSLEGAFVIGITPLNINSGKNELMSAYPNNKSLSTLSDDFTLKTIPTIIYKK